MFASQCPDTRRTPNKPVRGRPDGPPPFGSVSQDTTNVTLWAVEKSMFTPAVTL